MSSVKVVDLGYPKIFLSFIFFKFASWNSYVLIHYLPKFKKFHRAVFSIAHPKYSNFEGILDPRW